MRQHIERMFELTRREVEAGSVERLLLGIGREAEARGGIAHVQGCVSFFISGYEDDSRELFEIPEVRRYFQKLDAVAPFFLFYIANEERGALVRLYVKMFLADGNFFGNTSPSAEDSQLFLEYITSRLNAVAQYSRSLEEKENTRVDTDDVAYHIMRSCGINVSRDDVKRMRS